MQNWKHTAFSDKPSYCQNLSHSEQVDARADTLDSQRKINWSECVWYS